MGGRSMAATTRIRSQEGTSMRKLLFATVAAIGCAVLQFALSGAAFAQPPIVIKFSHVVSPDAPKGKAAVVFKDLAEKYTSG